jgi:DNA polymerase phi
MLSSAPTWALPILFSSNLMRCLIGQRNESSKLLYEAATEPLKKMKTRVRQNPELAVIMVTGLTSGNGSVFFDGITKTKTLQELITLADEDAFEKLITRFESLMRSPDAGDQKSADNVRQALADLLLSGLRSKVKEQAEGSITTSWIGDLLSLFSKYAYLVPKPIKSEQEFPLPAVSPEGRVMYQHRLSSCLAHLLTVHSKDPSKWPWFVVRKIHSITKSSRPYDLALEAEKPVLKTLKRAYKITEEIAADNSKDQLAINRAFVLLFSLTLLQAYGGDPEAISLLEELETCYKTIEADESASGSFDQLIEILLSFLSKPVALFRKMAEQTFATFSGEITEDGLQSFIAILEQKESLSGQQELFDRVDSEEDEGGEDDSDEPIGSDVEVMEASDEADDDPLDDIDGSEDDGGIDPELAQFEHLLAETLKTSRPTDENGVEESSDGESMDDEQMMAIEPHLENIFKQRASEANKKKEKKDARETVIGFKKRVLDLLTIYVKQESGKPITMHLILPLLRLVRTTNEPSLAQKANEVLKQYYATCTKLKVHPVPADIEVTWTLLKDIHTEAHKKAPKQHGAACSRASLFVVKALVNVDRRNADRAAEVYCETQKDWFKKRRTVMLPNFFTEWISWSAEARKKWS